MLFNILNAYLLKGVKTHMERDVYHLNATLLHASEDLSAEVKAGSGSGN